MKNIIKVFTVIILFCNQSNVNAQQEAQFTHYIDNLLYYNPGYAGSRGMLNFTGIHRQQWVGFDGAPTSQALSIHSPLKYESIGLGFSLLNDKVGPLNRTWINADFSYSLKFKRNNAKLAFGLTGGIDLMNANLNGLSLNQSNDPSFSNNYKGELLPNFGAGIYYHSDKFFFGLSSPKILKNKIKAGDFSFRDQNHFYGMIGGYLQLNRMLKLRPSALLKVTPNSPFSLDMSLAMIIYDKFWIGGNYRLQESAGVLLQYQISPQFKVGYSFDCNTNKLVKYNFGTHEIMLSYDLNFKNKKIVTPRYF